MTAIWKHVVTLTAFVALLWASPAAARPGENDPPAGMTVSLVKNGQPMTVKAMVLYAGSKPKGADLTAVNTATFKEEDVGDRRRAATLLLDMFDDGSANVLFVVQGVTPPTPAPGSTRRDLGEITIGRGVRLTIDAGAGTATDPKEPSVSSNLPRTLEEALGPRSKRQNGPFSRLYVGIAGGYSTTVPSLSFCQDNAAKLGQLGARQNACGLNGTNGFYGVSGGMTFARIFGSDLVAAGGWADFGRTQPAAEGSTSNVSIVRRAEEHFRGGWAGGGLQRTWSTWNLQGTLAVTYLARETSTTDTFTRLSDRQSSASTTSRRDTDVQPMVSLELFRRTGPFFIGTGYRYTRFEDAVKTQGLHGVYGTIKYSRTPPLRFRPVKI